MIASAWIWVALATVQQEPVPRDGLSRLRPSAAAQQGAGTEALPPSAERAIYPWLATDAQGRVSANWLVPGGEDGNALLWARRLPDGSWTEAEEVARGQNWFVNWADHPVHAVDAAGRVLATWLQKVPGSTYSYHVHLRLRDAEGVWGEAHRLHEDDSPTEHGFVSIAPVAGGGFVAAWLDGRATGSKEPMQLRARRTLADGSFGPELLVDPRVCDCCATTLVADADGSFWLAYRDRSEEEVRDLGLVRLQLGEEGRLLHNSRDFPADAWVMPGCPVNGPASARWQGKAAVVWFTAHPDPRIRLARGDAVSVVRSEAGVLGRVSCAVIGDQLAVSWLETRRGRTSWWIQFFRLDEQERIRPASTARPIAQVLGTRAEGFLRLAAAGEQALAVWTEAKPQRLRARLLQGD